MAKPQVHDDALKAIATKLIKLGKRLLAEGKTTEQISDAVGVRTRELYAKAAREEAASTAPKLLAPGESSFPSGRLTSQASDVGRDLPSTPRPPDIGQWRDSKPTSGFGPPTGAPRKAPKGGGKTAMKNIMKNKEGGTSAVVPAPPTAPTPAGAANVLGRARERHVGKAGPDYIAQAGDGKRKKTAEQIEAIVQANKAEHAQRSKYLPGVGTRQADSASRKAAHGSPAEVARREAARIAAAKRKAKYKKDFGPQ